MLQQLYIRNYALIREVRMDFSEGFSVLTGETGAGKSILLGALGLVLGERADTSVLHDPSEKCIVEGLFREPRLAQHPLAVDLDLAGETEWCIRREVGANGKSRAFLNDTVVTLAQLQSFTAELVDLHQQFDTLELTETDRQRELLDVMAGLLPQVETYRIHYESWRRDLALLQELEIKQARAQQEQEYQLHILQELEEAAFQPGEIEALEEKVRIGGQSEAMLVAIAAATQQLQGEGENIQQQLRRLQQSLNPFEKNEQQVREWLDRLRSVDMELRELSREMDRYGAREPYDPQTLAQWQERVSLGFRLLKKHGLQTTDQLLELQEKLQAQLQSVQSLESHIRELQQSTRQQEKSLRTQASSIHDGRQAAITPWTKKINALLAQVGMPAARFGIALEPTDLQSTGADTCSFLFDANYGGGKSEPNWQPVRKVASGGELSRLMLCIKSLVADQMQLPTLIFDEIDTGISGEAAKQVGRLLRTLGTNRQVICVTHQPQVAAKGQHHWHVTKTAANRGIETQVQLLTESQRVEVLARIMGGEPPTDLARQNAAELLAG
jgi:DNA repair protein RecN (Recombination protein N)